MIVYILWWIHEHITYIIVKLWWVVNGFYWLVVMIEKFWSLKFRRLCIPWWNQLTGLANKNIFCMISEMDDPSSWSHSHNIICLPGFISFPTLTLVVFHHIRTLESTCRVQRVGLYAERSWLILQGIGFIYFFAYLIS